MVPHTCKSCGHVYGEDNAFVLQSRCCPQCGQNVKLKQRQWQPYSKIIISAILGVIILLVFFFTSELLKV
jgi:hypothetical protein